MSILSVILVALIVMTVIIIKRRDSVPPVITFESGEIVYNEGESESVLLQYIKATDGSHDQVQMALLMLRIEIAAWDKLASGY